VYRNRRATRVILRPMCLIVLAHRASPRHPFALAANRDELYARPSHKAAYWPDAPDVFGGRDAVAGGSWLALNRDGRFAAVTNLRGATPRMRSRGDLVRDFVTRQIDPLEYAKSIAVEQYAGFHLLVGKIDTNVVYLASSGELAELEPGVHAFSNAPTGEHWPKEALAIEAMTRALGSEAIEEELLRFLTTPRTSGAVESEVFIKGELYGTRASTVIVSSADGITFTERP
jgi:uncharacterized protein with NRDE domain